MKSRLALLVIAFVWFIAGAFYYPKWTKSATEATISWDVSGYYHYLPAIFIYKDIKQQAWMNGINEKYLPSMAYDQAFGHVNSGNKVNKYTIGQSILYAPFFFLAHGYATLTKAYPADGYSRPYQVTLWFGSLLVSILGLFLLRKILLAYFDDTTVAWTLVALGLGTHWFEYASITNAMSHTWLFTLLCALVLFTIRFYKKMDWLSAVGIGICLGMAVLTRPTEIIWGLIPLLWNISSLRERINFLLAQWRKIIIAAIVCGAIVSIQFIYWKYVAGEWIVYSYGDQGFNWLNPKIWRGLMGVNVGWWIYTPMMLIAMFGWASLYKKHKPVFWPVFLTSILAIYITLAWAHWESGGGLGQRNLIQVYPLLAFPLASLITWLYRNRTGKWIWFVLLAANIYYTAWWMHQAHKGGFFQAGQMTTPYFYSVVGRLQPERDRFKLLDTKEYFNGAPNDLQPVFKEDFESIASPCQTFMPDSTKASCLNATNQFIGPFNLNVPASCTDWLRLEGDFTIQTREWNVWKYTQWIIQFYQGETVVKTNMIRVHRLVPYDQTATHLFFDVKLPASGFDNATMTFWNADSPNTLVIDNLTVSCFSGQ